MEVKPLWLDQAEVMDLAWSVINNLVSTQFWSRMTLVRYACRNFWRQSTIGSLLVTGLKRAQCMRNVHFRPPEMRKWLRSFSFDGAVGTDTEEPPPAWARCKYNASNVELHSCSVVTVASVVDYLWCITSLFITVAIVVNIQQDEWTDRVVVIINYFISSAQICTVLKGPPIYNTQGQF